MHTLRIQARQGLLLYLALHAEHCTTSRTARAAGIESAELQYNGQARTISLRTPTALVHWLPTPPQPHLWKEITARKGLADVIVDALSAVDADSRASMLADVVVVGGSAALVGLGDRLEEELKGLLPEAMGERVDVRVPEAGELQHRCGSLGRVVPCSSILRDSSVLRASHSR